MRQQRIENIITGLTGIESTEVINQSHLHNAHAGSPQTGESHYLIRLKLKSDYTVLQITLHRQIYQALSQEFLNGLHALSIEIINN